MIHVDRKKGRGGGVAMYINFKLKYKTRKDIYIDGIESAFIEVDNKFGKNIIVGTLYRPPGNNVNNFLENLDKELDKISSENKHVYMMGDFNIDLSHSLQSISSNTYPRRTENHVIDNNTNAFLNILSSYAFHPCINVPTRITPISSTLIDNIFTNSCNDNNSGVFTYDVTDHLPIFLISSELKINKAKKVNKKKHRKENPNTILALNEDLGNEDWHEVTGENDVNKAYKSFIDKLTHYYNKKFLMYHLSKTSNTKMI